MKRFKSNSLPCALFVVSIVFFSQAAHASLILYDFNGGSTMSTDTDVNSTATSYSPSIGGVSSSTDSGFARATDFPSANTLTTLSEFSVTANSGYLLDLDSLDFSYGVTQVPALDTRNSQFQIYTDVDSYTTPIFDSGLLSGTGNRSLSTNIDLTGTSYNNLSDITFRIRGLVSDNTGAANQNIMRILSTQTTGGGNLAGATDLVLNGTSFAIPEPSGAPLFALAALLLGLCRRCRRPLRA